MDKKILTTEVVECGLSTKARRQNDNLLGQVSTHDTLPGRRRLTRAVEGKDEKTDGESQNRCVQRLGSNFLQNEGFPRRMNWVND